MEKAQLYPNSSRAFCPLTFKLGAQLGAPFIDISQVFCRSTNLDAQESWLLLNCHHSAGVSILSLNLCGIVPTALLLSSQAYSKDGFFMNCRHSAEVSILSLNLCGIVPTALPLSSHIFTSLCPPLQLEDLPKFNKPKLLKRFIRRMTDRELQREKLQVLLSSTHLLSVSIYEYVQRKLFLCKVDR